MKKIQKWMGVALAATVLALDGIAVIVHPDNPVSDLDVDAIARLYTGEMANWKDVGGSDVPVVLIGGGERHLGRL